MNIIFLSYRISGNDGVSLEAENWRRILERMGHKVKFVAGKLDRAGVVIPELHFQSPKVVRIHDSVVFGKKRYRSVEAHTFDVAGTIEGKLRDLFAQYSRTDLLIIANVLSLPMHFPLSIALSRVISDLQIPTIARHHDFWWERDRYLKSHLFPFFKRWFPPDLPTIKHIVINSYAQAELQNRTGLKSEIIWDSFDFNSDLNMPDGYNKHWRSDFGIAPDDVVFLQATRIIPRKRIELSIELVKRINNPKAILVLAGYAGDEGREYERKIRKLAKTAGIRHKFIGKFVDTKRRIVHKANGEYSVKKRVYTLWDCYMNSDFVTYPTKIEGFGNQFVESVYFKKPVIITPYPVFRKDIAPLDFEVISFNNKVSEKVIGRIQELINNKNKLNNLVEKNFDLGKKFFSYEWVEGKLRNLFKDMGLS